MANNPVDLTGAPPNIDGMRQNLGLNAGASAPEVEFAPRSPFAQKRSEAMPGAEYFADRYKLYADNPSAAADMHNDYERLLRNQDNSTVIGQMLGIESYQDDGVRVVLENPPQTGVANKMDPRAIEETLNLSQVDRDRLDALAITDGLLRDQDAVAWAYPVHMVDEADIPSQGLPWSTVNSAVFRSPLIRSREVAEAGKLVDAPAPDDVIKAAKYGNKWEDYISVSEPADGSGGVMFTNIGGLPPAVFQAKVREIRDQLPYWESSYGMHTQWGRADTGYIAGQQAMQERIDSLNPELKARVGAAIDTLRPYTKQIGSYHAGRNASRGK